MRRTACALVAGAAAWLGAAGAFADPAINGVAVNSAIANGNSNVAVGAFATARQAIGVVNGKTEVNGALDNTTVANGNANVSTGISRGGSRSR